MKCTTLFGMVYIYYIIIYSYLKFDIFVWPIHIYLGQFKIELVKLKNKSGPVNFLLISDTAYIYIARIRNMQARFHVDISNIC